MLITSPSVLERPTPSIYEHPSPSTSVNKSLCLDEEQITSIQHHDQEIIIKNLLDLHMLNPKAQIML